MKNRGQVFLIGIFVVLVIVLALSFYFYYNGVPTFTGRTVQEKKVTLVEKESLADKIVAPMSLNVYATIGEDNKEEFDVSNYNDKLIRVSCNFPPFQVGVPSSQCFTYDANGNFVGTGEVSILPGRTQTFIASVRPHDNIRIQRGDVETRIDIGKGEYRGEIELRAYEEDKKETVSVISIPVKIFVSD
jgi:hypothetical protein